MTLVDPVEPPRLDVIGRPHLMGIGGAGMSGIARLLLARGFVVSGCDSHESAVLRELREEGASIAVGHDPAHCADCDTMVLSSAVRHTDGEVVEARRRGLRVLPRAAALASLMAGRRGVAVTGTHGKTTTTSLLASVLWHCGADPSFLVGGVLTATASPGSPGDPATRGVAARDGGGDVFVAEADESDASFLLLSPHIAVVTNVEADHLDNYGTVEAVHAAFTRFLDRIRPDGVLVCCADDEGARTLAAEARRRGIDVRSYGESAGADVRVEAFDPSGLGSSFDLVVEGRRLGRVRLPIPGRHNALNAAAALAAGMRLGYDFDDLVDAVARFRGVRRRFDPRGEAGGVRVFDSYAHHPTEIAADLRTARDVADGGRVIVAFQPHLYTRTRFFAAEIGRALSLADEVVVLDVYAAREDPDPGVTGELVAAAVPLAAGRVRYVADFDAVPPVLVELARPGDVVLTLGAGDITGLGPRVVAALPSGTAGRGSRSVGVAGDVAGTGANEGRVSAG